MVFAADSPEALLSCSLDSFIYGQAPLHKPNDFSARFAEKPSLASKQKEPTHR
jgi:hypothetical protein